LRQFALKLNPVRRHKRFLAFTALRLNASKNGFAMSLMPYYETSQHLAFRPDLQGLRAVAILLVVCAHAGLPLFSGGFVGVDVFFVLSGYLITGLLQRELAHSGRIALMRFYARRLKRLLPALLAMLTIMASVALWLLSDVEARAQLASAPFAATWTSNLYFALAAFDYFDELATRDLFLHSWSLGVEEQFYLLWPALLLAAALIDRRRAAHANDNGIRVLGLAGLASLALMLYWTFAMPQAAFYQMPARIWQFALGALLSLACQHHPASVARWLSPFGGRAAGLALGGGMALIIGSAMLLDQHAIYPGFSALLPSVGSALVILAGQRLSEARDNPLAQPMLVWLGDRSYSWYLWHWPILMLGFSLGFEGNPPVTLALVLLSLLMAMLSYQWIERPFWKGRFSHAAPRRILLLSLLLMAACVAALFHSLREPIPRATAGNLANQWRSDFPLLYRQPCDAWFHHARVEPCVFGAEQAPHTAVLLGDSIGVQWFSMVPALFAEPEWRTVVLTKSACAMVDTEYVYSRIGQVYTVCSEWRNAVLDTLDQLKPEVLILGSAATYDFNPAQWVDGSTRVLARLSQAAGKVFLIPGTPSLGFNGPGCVARQLTPEGRIDRTACAAADRLQKVAAVSGYLAQAASRFPNVHLLDLNPLVCPDGECNAISREGVVVFRDNQHLTDRFVRSQTAAIGEKIHRF
jgi:peptidoglycan/LPS O-acetylase OafA/YrhL